MDSRSLGVWRKRLSRMTAGLLAMAFMNGGLAGPVAPALSRPATITAKAPTSVLLAVTRAGDRLVAVGERGIVLRSDDDGRMWSQSNVPVSVTLTAVSFVDPKRGWVVGHGGIVLHTDDGGVTWEKQLDGVEAAKLISAAARRHADATSEDPNSAQAVADAERLVAEGPDKPFFDVWFQDPSTGYVVGAFGMMLRTSDGGKSWAPWGERLGNQASAHLYSIRPTAGAIYIVGEMGSVFRSADGGATFSKLEVPYAGSFFGQVVPANTPGPLVFGLLGNAVVSADCNLAWEVSKTGTRATIAAAEVVADRSIVAVTSAGTLIRSIDGGRSFQALAYKPMWPLTGLTQASDGGLILVGLGGVQRLDKRPDVVKTGVSS